MADVSSYRSENELDLDMNMSINFHERVIKQIDEEYWAAWWFHQPRKEEWMKRLKLYNNQKREKSRIGSPDIFSFHQSLLSQLYDDKFSAHFQGRIDDDDDRGDNLTIMAENDYDDMRMAELDYEWDFDASLFGRGLLFFNDWDYSNLHPLAEVIDPLTWIRDPNAQSVNGNAMGMNGMRFGGREIRRTHAEIWDSGDYFNYEYLKKDTQGFRTFSPLWDTERARKEAQGFQTPYQSYSLTTNLDWTLLQWFTIIDGDKYMVELGNDRKLLVRMEKLKYWPILDRAMYPIAHDWDGVSVFDIMEDKQRFRAELLNIYGDLAKAKLYEMWLFDENKIRKNVDMDFEFQKRIPVDGDPSKALMPIQHGSAGSEVNFVMDFLDQASQRGLGLNSQTLGQPPPPQKGGKQTATATQGQNTSADKRMMVAQKIWGWSERAKWRRWYDMYDENFTSAVSSKVLRIEGPSGNEYREVGRDDVICDHESGPHITIETKSQTEARKAREYQMLKDYLGQVFQMPETDKLYGVRKLGQKVLKKREVLSLVPYTFDERQALDENGKLNDGKTVKVKITDNHQVHLRVHEETDDTPEAEAHIRMHEMALTIKRANPGIFPQMNSEGQNPQEANMPSSGQDPKQTGNKVKHAAPAMEGMGHGLASVGGQ